MTREEHLRYCRVCRNQKFDKNQGIICSLTDKPADFVGTCSSYSEDFGLKLKEDAAKVGREIVNKTASKGKRFANFLLDMLFYLVFSFMFGIILGVVVFLVAPSFAYIFEEENKLLEYLLGFISGMIYYTLLEATTGKTMAKFITKTKVVDENGNKPELGTILLRSLARFIPLEAFSFLGSDGSGWHDKLSKTRVIDV